MHRGGVVGVNIGQVLTFIHPQWEVRDCRECVHQVCGEQHRQSRTHQRVHSGRQMYCGV